MDRHSFLQQAVKATGPQKPFWMQSAKKASWEPAFPPILINKHVQLQGLLLRASVAPRSQGQDVSLQSPASAFWRVLKARRGCGRRGGCRGRWSL